MSINKELINFKKKIKFNYNINILYINNKFIKIKFYDIILNYYFIKNELFIYIKKNIINKINLKINFFYFNYVNLINKIKITIYLNSKIKLFIKENYYLYNKYNLFLNLFILNIYLKKLSNIIYLKFKNVNINIYNILNIYQKKFTKFILYDINLYEYISLNKINIYNLDNYCKNFIYGIYIINNYQYIKNNIYIKNNFNNSINNQKYIGIYDDKSTTILKGIIDVEKYTKNNISYQNYKNFVLSNKVYIDYKPYLNIHTNKIKCSHGFNLGNIDKNILFYLQSRGINIYKAKLIYFLSILSKNIKDIKIYKIIINKIKKKLKTIFNKKKNV
ncbi:MAG: SufD family Fe-S cluster assembly protein [Candidatus Shikimatogenerans sp. JK-2022]|nr:SufD family Fe-S cluster assembly protein [Candidatus Shikimatogenerans bostrichidophilus]